MIGVFVSFHAFLLGILIFKVLTAWRLYKSFGVKGSIAKRCSRLLYIFARYKAQKLLRTLLTYRLLQRRGPNWGRSNCIPVFPLHLLWSPHSFPGPSALRKKFILITFGTDHVDRLVTSMEAGRGVLRFFVGKPEGKRPQGRPRCRWEDNIKMDIQEVGCIQLA
jgi:hypothetical protein